MQCFFGEFSNSASRSVYFWQLVYFRRKNSRNQAKLRRRRWRFKEKWLTFGKKWKLTEGRQMKIGRGSKVLFKCWWSVVHVHAIAGFYIRQPLNPMSAMSGHRCMSGKMFDLFTSYTECLQVLIRLVDSVMQLQFNNNFTWIVCGHVCFVHIEFLEFYT